MEEDVGYMIGGGWWHRTHLTLCSTPGHNTSSFIIITQQPLTDHQQLGHQHKHLLVVMGQGGVLVMSVEAQCAPLPLSLTPAAAPPVTDHSSASSVR